MHDTIAKSTLEQQTIVREMQKRLTENEKKAIELSSNYDDLSTKVAVKECLVDLVQCIENRHSDRELASKEEVQSILNTLIGTIEISEMQNQIEELSSLKQEMKSSHAELQAVNEAMSQAHDDFKREKIELLKKQQAKEKATKEKFQKILQNSKNRLERAEIEMILETEVVTKIIERSILSRSSSASDERFSDMVTLHSTEIGRLKDEYEAKKLQISIEHENQRLCDAVAICLEKLVSKVIEENSTLVVKDESPEEIKNHYAELKKEHSEIWTRYLSGRFECISQYKELDKSIDELWSAYLVICPFDKLTKLVNCYDGIVRIMINNDNISALMCGKTTDCLRSKENREYW